MIVLPWAPLNNVYYRHTARGGHVHVYLSPEGKAYKELAGWKAREQFHGEPLEGPLSIVARCYRPRAVGDWDGPLKALCDSMENVLYVNDSQIVEAHIYRCDSRSDPRIELEVTEVQR